MCVHLLGDAATVTQRLYAYSMLYPHLYFFAFRQRYAVVFYPLYLAISGGAAFKRACASRQRKP